MIPAAHYYWGLWGLGMFKGDTEGYDYLGYSLVHYKEFLLELEELDSHSREELRNQANFL